MAGMIRTREAWAPVRGHDGHWRLRHIERPPATSTFALPMVPLKKLLLPPDEPVWFWSGTLFKEPGPPPQRILLGGALCDLQALWYLDQVFAEDPLYQRHRQRLLVVGSACRPSAHCRCRPSVLPIAGDLFLADDRVWILSARGEALFTELDGSRLMPVPEPLPWPEAASLQPPQIDEALFKASRGDATWEENAAACLSCGACSAVCPTCYCYDMVDRPAPTGEAARQRCWDNCFFADHGEVAGGRNFRPSLGSRLRFRLEHKLLGFGALRGRASCVGCGRCRAACPAGIDLDEVAAQLAGGQGS